MLAVLSRLSSHYIQQSIVRNISTTNTFNPLWFKATNILFGEPLKKKKRIDPAILRHREERKRRKLEKEIRRLEKHARQLRPISEMEIPFKLIDNPQRIRKSVVSPDTLEKRILLEKKWSEYKFQEHLRDLQIIDAILSSQKNALHQLQIESEALYQAAIQINPPSSSLLPHLSNGSKLLVNTPSIHNYTSPDGNYTNITVKFDGDDINDQRQ